MPNSKILIVEDEGIIAKDIKNILSFLGYSVIAVASSGEEAIEKAKEMHPDLVLMDIVLEGDMDGVKAAEQIRDSFDIPVIYLTAYSDNTTLQRAKITEPYGYILKPFQERELYTTIEMALYKHQVEKKLKESEEKFRAIFEHATDGMLVVDLETKKFLTGNTMICEMLGYSPEEIKNLKVADIHAQEDLPYVLATFEELARGEYTLAADIPVKRKDGNIFYADINASRISLYEKPCIMGSFRDITERKRMQDSLMESERQLRTLSSSILSAQEQDRKRISRELHDDLGQILTAVLLDISRAEKQKIFISSGSYNFMKRLRLILQEALQRVRNLSAILRPGVLDQLGLKAAVVSFLEEMEEQTGLKIIKKMQVHYNNIPESVSIAIYRILQEATTNIVKHAEAKQVIVKLRSDSKTISISIKDDGQGFNPESLPIDKGIGFLGMKERVEWLGGVFKIESAHGRGTNIYAEFPLSSRK